MKAQRLARHAPVRMPGAAGQTLLAFLRPLLLFLLLLLSRAALTESAASEPDTTDMSLAECRQAGFDPWQLSCATCDLLPTVHIPTCASCCRQYKATDAHTHRYGAALVGHAYVQRYFPEVQSLIDEDMDDIVLKKGRDRLVIKQLERGDGYYQRPTPSLVMFFDGIPDSFDTATALQLQQSAKEVIVLDGWKRDDIRDMLYALLPDRN